MRKRKTTRTWREIVRRRTDLKAAERRKQRSRRFDRRRKAFATMRGRKKAVRDSRARRPTCKEHVAAKQTANRFGVSVTTIRRWEKKLLDKVSDKGGRQPLLSLEIISFVVLLRTLCEWGAIRIAAELRKKGIAQVSQTTVHRMFKKDYLPTKTYHPKGKSNGRSLAAIGNEHPMNSGTSISPVRFLSLHSRCMCGLSWTITPGSLSPSRESHRSKPHR